jgi:hypothetical protein
VWAASSFSFPWLCVWVMIPSSFWNTIPAILIYSYVRSAAWCLQSSGLYWSSLIMLFSSWYSRQSNNVFEITLDSKFFPSSFHWHVIIMLAFNGSPLCYIRDTNNILSINVLSLFCVLQICFVYCVVNGIERLLLSLKSEFRPYDWVHPVFVHCGHGNSSVL